MHVTLIGAGPRGLVTLERLTERYRLNQEKINITLIDPHGVGGRVWQVEQPHELIMNSNVNFVSLFTDSSVQMNGPVTPGPSLYEWSKTAEAKEFIEDLHFDNEEYLLKELAIIQPNNYASRSLYGTYQKWFYEHLVANLPDNVHLELIKDEVYNVIKSNEQYVVELNNHFFKTDAVVMSLGHIENFPTPEESSFSKFAKKNKLTYVTPTHPQEYDFSDLQAQQTIIIRGLGLSFFDAVTMLTQGRGGHFTREANQQLVYHPSGNEPQIIAGSRRGFPFHGKGTNQKQTNENDQPHFLTADWFAKHTKPGSVSGESFIELVHAEVEYVYYQRLIQMKYPSINQETFLDEFIKSTNRTEFIQDSLIEPSDYWNWDYVLGHTNTQNSLVEYLIHDYTDAKLGNKTGPFTSAFDMLHDIRDLIRQVVKLELLSPVDYQKYFLNQFKGENSFLSVGPPESRIEELTALISAGIVTVLKPRMQLNADQQTGKFVTFSALDVPTQYSASYLVEARLPAINANKTTSYLIKSLLNSGIVKPYSLKLPGQITYQTGGIVTDKKVKNSGKGLFFWGVPTEGKSWFTTVSPRPNNNDKVFIDADQIAEKIENL